MIKFIIYTLLFNTVLSAVEITQSQQNGILMEAALFIGIFGTMGIISYIYSSRHAKSYKKPEVVPKTVDATVLDRISKLSEMLENGILTEKEFRLLKNYHLNT